jgi:hypothetical protein
VREPQEGNCCERGSKPLKLRFIVKQGAGGTGEFDFDAPGQTQGDLVVVELAQERAWALGYGLMEVAGGEKRGAA